MHGLIYAGRKLGEDTLATLLFAALLLTTDDLRIAVAGGILLGLGQLLFDLWRRRGANSMQAISLFLVIGFGLAGLFVIQYLSMRLVGRTRRQAATPVLKS